MLIIEKLLAISIFITMATLLLQDFGIESVNQVSERLRHSLHRQIKAAQNLGVATGCVTICPDCPSRVSTNSIDQSPSPSEEVFVVKPCSQNFGEGYSHALIYWPLQKGYSVHWKGFRRDVAAGFDGYGKPLPGSGSFWLCHDLAKNTEKVVARVIVSNNGRLKLDENIASGNRNCS